MIRGTSILNLLWSTTTFTNITSSIDTTNLLWSTIGLSNITSSIDTTN
ncbi:MAG: hypothetical protein M5F18_06250 [Asgard group archaeon]|nr:hypothetical protein [Asgard group archaeon]